MTPAPCTVQPADPQELPLSGEANVNPSQIDPNATAILARYPAAQRQLRRRRFQFHRQREHWHRRQRAVVPLGPQLQREGHADGSIHERRSGPGRVSTASYWGDDNFPSVNSDWNFTAKNAVAKLTYLITPRMVNDFQFGFTNNFIHFQTGESSDPTLASRVGFTLHGAVPARPAARFPASTAWTALVPCSTRRPLRIGSRCCRGKMTWRTPFGSHNVKFGGFFGRSRKREPANGGEDDYGAGTLTFSNFQDLLLGNLAELPGRADAEPGL